MKDELREATAPRLALGGRMTDSIVHELGASAPTGAPQAQKASPAVSGAEPAPTETNMHQVVPGLSVTIADREFRDYTHITINGVMVPVVRIIGLALAEADSPQAPRARFEQWVTSPPYEMLAERWPNDAENYAWPDCYCDRAVSLAWEAWQARSSPAVSGAEPSAWVNAESLALLRERPDGATIGASPTRTEFWSTPLYERPSGAELPAPTKEDLATIRHARMFLSTRERIHPEGLRQWDEMVERLAASSRNTEAEQAPKEVK